jgi:hypothetical protein
MLRSTPEELNMNELLDITMWLLDRLADLARLIGRWP